MKNEAKIATRRKLSLIAKQAAVALSGIAASAIASAATAPTDLNSIGGQAYDLFFNQGYDSGIAYVVAGILGVLGFIQIKQDWKQAVGLGVGAAGVGGLPGILTALGASI